MMQDLYFCGMTFLSEQCQYTSFRILPPGTRFNLLAANPPFKGGHKEKHIARILTDYITHCIVTNKIPIWVKTGRKILTQYSEYLPHLPKESIMKTAEEIIEGLPLSINDIARLVVELKEELGQSVRGLQKVEMMQLLRRVLRLGVGELAKQEHTVSFETAVWASVEARACRRATTRRDLRHYARRLLRVPGVGERPLRAMCTRECQELLRAAFGGSASSFRKGRAMLHSVFAHGIRQEWCADNPVARVEVPRVQEREIVPLCREEVERLEIAVQQPEHKAMRLSLYLLLYCGLRPHEVARLRQQDVQPERGCVVVPGRCSKTGGGRVVPLRRRELLRGMRLRIPRNWEARWLRLRRAAGFAPGQWVPDVCRHTFASYHAARFRDLSALQLEMGHRSTDLLRTRYLNLPQVEEAKRYWCGV